MKNSKLGRLTFAAVLLAGMTTWVSCGDDKEKVEPIAAPDASFTSTLDGKTVTFTNTTVGESVTYAWDFGDDASSTEAAPVHTYDANGTYVVKLTATNEGGSDVSSAVLEVINITIDGNLSDWDDVPALAYDAEGVFKEVKIENLGKDKLYVYIKGTSEMTSFLDFYLNLDYAKLEDNDTTGLFTGVYPLSNLGWDILFEGFFGTTTGRDDISGMFYGVFYHPDDDGKFYNNTSFGTREEPSLPAELLKFTDMQSVGSDLAYEFSIDLNFFPTDLQPAQGDEIQLFIDEWDNPADNVDAWWGGFSAHFPTGQATETGEAVTYLLK